MVAHSDVEAGEAVLEEAAAVHGPSNKSGKKADVCLECQGGMKLAMARTILISSHLQGWA